jgi:dephospho-CoA kinase
VEGMIKVAVTGGIGSGKTTVCRIFNILGIPVFNADVEAKKIMEKDLDVIKNLIDFFGADIYLENGVLDRKKLAAIIFNDKIALRNVNSIVHPAVHRYFEQWAQNQASPYVIEETAIVFETGGSEKFDFVVVVTAPLDEKLNRVMIRDGSTRDQVLERIKNQWSDEEKIKRAQYTVYGGDEQFLIPQVIEIHKNIIRNGKIW